MKILDNALNQQKQISFQIKDSSLFINDEVYDRIESVTLLDISQLIPQKPLIFQLQSAQRGISLFEAADMKEKQKFFESFKSVVQSGQQVSGIDVIRSVKEAESKAQFLIDQIQASQSTIQEFNLKLRLIEQDGVEMEQIDSKKLLQAALSQSSNLESRYIADKKTFKRLQQIKNSEVDNVQGEFQDLSRKVTQLHDKLDLWRRKEGLKLYSMGFTVLILFVVMLMLLYGVKMTARLCLRWLLS